MDHAGITMKLKQSLPALAILAAAALVAWLAYGVRYAPVLFSDDWAFIVDQYIYGTLQWLDWSNRRPLLDAPIIMATGLFGLNTRALYWVLVGLVVLAALQLYGLLRRTDAGSRSFSLLAALIFLVFPADYTRTWLTMIGIWSAMNLLLFYAHLLLSYANKGAIWLLVTACLVLLVSLGIYEAQLGLASAWALALLLIRRDIPLARKIALLTPIAVGLLFLAWRILGAPATGVVDPYIAHIQFNPQGIVLRIVFGLGLLVWSWAVVVREALQLDNKLALVGLVVLACGLFALIGFVLARMSLPDAPPDSRHRWQLQMRKALVLLLAGGALTVAGFLPIVSIYLPSLSGVGTRFSLFALPGASLAVAALLWMIGILLGRSERRAEMIMLSSALPLLLIGIWTQVWVRHDAAKNWETQKLIWSGLASAAPNFTDGTAVYFILPRYSEQPTMHNWHRTPMDAPWEVTSALRVLYDNSSLRGDRMFLDNKPRYRSPQLVDDGIVEYWTQEKIPYESAVFVAYDDQSHAVRVVDDLQTELSLPWSPSGYAPRARITTPPANGYQHRWLVGFLEPSNP